MPFVAHRSRQKQANAEAGSLTHLDGKGRARMVDVSAKAPTSRRAVAEGKITFGAAALKALLDPALAPKGDVVGVARIAGIQAAKRTSELIPLCHPLSLSHVGVDFEVDTVGMCIIARAEAATTATTGVEMEALTAVTVALLTIYDMLKALDKRMVIGAIRLIRKEGGKSDLFEAASIGKTAIRRGRTR
jgi:cyclic pyranopterin monophosphate synthase